MRYTLASSAGKGRINEDLVVVYERDGCTDLVLMDGATPLTPERCLAAGASDPAWFVRRFAQDLGCVLRADGDQEALVLEALEHTRAAYRAAGGHADVPPYAWPIATLAWVRVSDPDADGSHTLDLFCLGDSKILLQLPDGAVRDLDPFENPQEQATQAAVAALVAEGILDPAERWARLLPMLRARRHEQNTAAHPAILCLEPRGPFAARRTRVTAPPGALLLVLSDGLYRLVDTYGLHSDGSLLDACRARGLDALLDELRAFEAGKEAAGLAAKTADDASAIAWRFT
ncbi:Protein phosphatase 2C [Massilia sp. PDC64]|nr:protein phosphatase 2C domain-containing protein [Massilia sp. PDC64]SDD37294.1 Protein phosphatase 2C [Massilia sp. PDC64]